MSATACGGRISGDPKPGRSTANTSTATTKPTTTKPTRSTTTTTTGSIAPVDGATKPGAKLKLGEPAQVPIAANSPVLIELTALTITKGDPADLAELKLTDPDAQGKVPYYLKLRVKNLDGGRHSGSSLTAIRGLQPNGRRGASVIIMSDFAKCDTVTPSTEFNKAGAVYETCEIVLVDPTSSVTAVAYAQRPSYTEEPVTWS
ncbi:MAG TPA: hypothetical protein VM677_14595 [Actinokineospora sp.]|nr:hypothetical protein [Actinokineospora sp.]